MTNSTIHQSLIELEDNLKEMASARQQVQTVAADSERLVSAINKLVKDIEKLRSQFSDATKNVTGNLFTGANEVNDAIKRHASQFEASVSGSLATTSQVVADFSQGINALEKKLESAVSLSKNSFNKQLENGAVKLLDQSQQIFDRHNRQVELAEQQFNSLGHSIQELQTQIHQTDFNREIVLLQQSVQGLGGRIDALQMEQQQQHEIFARSLAILRQESGKKMDLLIKLICLAGLFAAGCLLVSIIK
jgi:phage shock protein A